ncbi:MAG: DUF1801 domain-containing protein [Parafilimonas sp.]
MAELKTKQTEENVTKFLNTVEDETKRKDCFEIIEMMKQVTGLPPKMWGTAIIGFGSYHYKYESGHEGDMCIIGFSPRKQNITLYIGISNENIQKLLPDLGKHRTGKGCLYINKLSDVNTDVLKKIIKTAFEYTRAK